MAHATATPSTQTLAQTPVPTHTNQVLEETYPNLDNNPFPFDASHTPYFDFNAMTMYSLWTTSPDTIHSNAAYISPSNSTDAAHHTTSSDTTDNGMATCAGGSLPCIGPPVTGPTTVMPCYANGDLGSLFNVGLVSNTSNTNTEQTVLHEHNKRNDQDGLQEQHGSPGGQGRSMQRRGHGGQPRA